MTNTAIHPAPEDLHMNEPRRFAAGRSPSPLAAAFVLALALPALAGCTGPSALERDYGSSVAAMQQAQTAEPATRATPGGQPVTSIDGDYSQAVMKVLRESASKPEELKQGVTINVAGDK